METSDLMKIAERFKALKLAGMAQAISDVAALPVQLWPTLLTMLNKLVDTEVSLRDNARTERLIKAAKFRYKVLIEDITCSTARNLTKDQLEALADCGFVRRGECDNNRSNWWRQDIPRLRPRQPGVSGRP